MLEVMEVVMEVVVAVMTAAGIGNAYATPTW